MSERKMKAGSLVYVLSMFYRMYNVPCVLICDDKSDDVEDDFPFVTVFVLKTGKIKEFIRSVTLREFSL